ncbi:MAG: hypothetical protein QOC85_3923 [Streptomyces sp.]|nr:hypothetical protein [Streptomyces sp.]
MVLEELKFEMDLETPTVDLYRNGWSPSADVTMGGMWLPGVVTGSSGKDYLGLRGFSDYIAGMTHVVSPLCGFRELEKSMGGNPPHLFPQYAGHDFYEPYQVDESADAVEIVYDSGQVRRDAAGVHWRDVDGRWEMTGKTISKVFVLRVPKQPGVEQEVYYRHELLSARGTVDGEAAEGYLHQDYCYGPEGFTYTELPIARQLEGMWVSWIHEYTDGELGGGCFWQGRGDLKFGPGYLLSDGETTVHGDIEAKITFDDANHPRRLDVAVGSQTFEFALDTVASPMHYFGRMTANSANRPVARSWCWIEHPGNLLTPEILDMKNERFRLARRR